MNLELLTKLNKNIIDIDEKFKIENEKNLEGYIRSEHCNIETHKKIHNKLYIESSVFFFFSLLFCFYSPFDNGLLNFPLSFIFFPLGAILIIEGGTLSEVFDSIESFFVYILISIFLGIITFLSIFFTSGYFELLFTPFFIAIIALSYILNHIKYCFGKKGLKTKKENDEFSSEYIKNNELSFAKKNKIHDTLALNLKKYSDIQHALLLNEIHHFTYLRLNSLSEKLAHENNFESFKHWQIHELEKTMNYDIEND